MNTSTEGLSLLGRMARIHILSATPVLYAKAPFRWCLTIIILMSIILLVSHVT